MEKGNSESVRAAKRQKLESDSAGDGREAQPQERPPSRSGFWFKTGDIILHVEDTQFRVHREILARHSNVFDDMFNMPQNKEGDRCVVEGQPIVELHDEVYEVEYMLSVFYDTVKRHDWAKPMCVTHISVLLGLGKKYDIGFFVDQALRCLRFDHPTSLADWETISLPKEYKKIDSKANVFVDDDDMEDIITLANKHSVLSIVPAAYLRFVLYYNLEVIFSPELTPGLSQEDRKNCVLGRDRLSTELWTRRAEWLHSKELLPVEGCTSQKACAALQWKVVDKFELWDPFRFDVALLPLSKQELSALCPKCAKAIRAKYDQIRAEVWNQLPTFFQLPEWEDLKDFDK